MKQERSRRLDTNAWKNPLTTLLSNAKSSTIYTKPTTFKHEKRTATRDETHGEQICNIKQKEKATNTDTYTNTHPSFPVRITIWSKKISYLTREHTCKSIKIVRAAQHERERERENKQKRRDSQCCYLHGRRRRTRVDPHEEVKLRKWVVMVTHRFAK